MPILFTIPVLSIVIFSILIILSVKTRRNWKQVPVGTPWPLALLREHGGWILAVAAMALKRDATGHGYGIPNQATGATEDREVANQS